MRHVSILYSLLALMLVLPQETQADPSTAVAAVTPEMLQSAMKDAEKEYEAALKPHPPKEKTKSATYSSDALSQMVTALTQAKQVEKGTLLEDLAKEVDILKNRLIVERTSLLATQSPKKVRVRGAMTIFNYRPEALYEVTSAVEHVSDIQLAAGETLTTPPMAGDTVRWNLGVMKSGAGLTERTHIIVKPLDEGIETNLIITTDQHIYQLRLKSADFHMPAVSWNYPEENQAKFEEAMKKKQSEEVITSANALRFNYLIEGDDYPWKPLRVFDDGKKTFIQMPSNLRVTEAPAFFLLEDGSEPILVNYRVKGDFYVVDRLFERAELRVGPKKRVRIELGRGKNFFERIFG